MPMYRDDAGHQVVHLGVGDVIVALAESGDGTDELIFVQYPEARPIGAPATEVQGTLTSEHQSVVRLLFTEVSALDVVLAQLSALRKEMTTKEV